MGVGTSIMLVAVGAIMRFAITAQATGFNIRTIGVILMVVGAVGFVLSLFFWNSWGGFGSGVSGSGVYRGRTVVTQTQDPMVSAAPIVQGAPIRTTQTTTEQSSVPRTTITRTDGDYV